LEDAEALALTIADIIPTLAQCSPETRTIASRKGLLARWEKHRTERIEKVVERTKAGSHVRKPTTDAEAQARKEKELRQKKGMDGEEDLHWLYGYNAQEFRRELRAEQ
jgi:hypothetical protein